MLPSPGWTLDSVEAQALNLYGGTYSTDCANPAAPRLRATTAALVVEQGAKRMTGRNVLAAYSYFGNYPPPDYRVVLMSQVRPGVALEFIVFEDRAGLYIELAGDPKVEATLGKALLGMKYRHCDAGGGQQQAAAPPPVPIPVLAPAQALAPATMSPADLLNDPKFKSAYYVALGGNATERWLAKLDGPAPPVRKIALGGVDYLLASACKPHDCADNNTVLLYAPSRQAVYGKVFQRGGTTWIGAPPAELVPELERLWRAEWRKDDG